MTSLSSSYDPTQFESRLYQQWESSGAFKPSGKGDPYTILLPPPNVTGTLHMGHAFQHTLQDALVRYHRMRGYDTLWQMGTDHAGIATEMVVSRNLAIEGKGETRDSLGREGFIAKVWEWKQQSGDTIERQMRRLGTSGDWSRRVFTMDPMAADAVAEAFVKLHEDGLIYRGQRLVNWDPVLKTAISDLEVENVEEDGFLWSIEYPLADGSGTPAESTGVSPRPSRAPVATRMGLSAMLTAALARRPASTPRSISANSRPTSPGKSGANPSLAIGGSVCPTLHRIAASINSNGTDVATWKISHSCSAFFNR